MELLNRNLNLLLIFEKICEISSYVLNRTSDDIPHISERLVQHIRSVDLVSRRVGARQMGITKVGASFSFLINAL